MQIDGKLREVGSTFGCDGECRGILLGIDSKPRVTIEVPTGRIRDLRVLKPGARVRVYKDGGEWDLKIGGGR